MKVVAPIFQQNGPPLIAHVAASMAKWLMCQPRAQETIVQVMAQLYQSLPPPPPPLKKKEDILVARPPVAWGKELRLVDPVLAFCDWTKEVLSDSSVSVWQQVTLCVQICP